VSAANSVFQSTGHITESTAHFYVPKLFFPLSDHYSNALPDSLWYQMEHFVNQYYKALLQRSTLEESIHLLKKNNADLKAKLKHIIEKNVGNH
jgi:hypothetical protein